MRHLEFPKNALRVSDVPIRTRRGQQSCYPWLHWWQWNNKSEREEALRQSPQHSLQCVCVGGGHSTRILPTRDAHLSWVLEFLLESVTKAGLCLVLWALTLTKVKLISIAWPKVTKVNHTIGIHCLAWTRIPNKQTLTWEDIRRA